MKVKDNRKICKITCQKCKSRLTISQDDLGYRIEGKSGYLFVDCVVCKQRSPVSANDLPTDW